MAIFKQLFKVILLAGISASAFASNIMLEQGYIRAMPASVPNTAAYLTLSNHGAATELVSASTPMARETMLHTLIEEDGLVKMRHVAAFPLPEHGQLTLQSSGDHIMIMGLKAPLQLGQKVPMTLSFANGETLNIELEVKSPHDAPAAQEHHHHHH
ncbi:MULTISPECIES: copper chaperone PCu(A)C [Shewanella]|uniref:copper chaperone PCu(A)C n=1 Tax=Shewanella TaxID=22 RepID=UPI0030048F17